MDFVQASLLERTAEVALFDGRAVEGKSENFAEVTKQFAIRMLVVQ